jgi:hypothetical protein
VEATTPAPSLALDFCGLRFASPIVLLSGCVGFGEEYTRVADLNHAERFGHVGLAIHQLHIWAKFGRLDAGLAKELANGLKEVAADSDSHGHHRHHHHHSFIDALFSHFGHGKLHFGRFHC